MRTAYNNEFLNEMRQTGDELADKVVHELFSDKEMAKQLRQLLSKTFRNDTILEGLPPFLADYFEQSAILPDWVDHALMRKGHQFFAKNSREIMALLGYLSLPYCYAAADGARVLWLSERIRDNTSQRLAETAQFVFDVMEKDAFEPTGYGIRSIQKVRLIHAAIRYHVNRSGKWEASEWGVPVNQEDMAGTNLAFSLIILRGLRKMGKVISFEDSEAYLYYWKVISHLLGIVPELLPEDGKMAFWLEKRISERTIKPSKEGQLLTQALMKSFDDNPPVTLPNGFHTSFIRFVLDERIADIIGIPEANWTTIMVKQQKYVNAMLTAFESEYQEAQAKKKLAFIKKNTIERIQFDKGFAIPMGLKNT